MLKKLKKTVEDTAQKASLETAYLRAKASGKWQHVEEIGRAVATLNRIRSQLQLQEKIGQMTDCNKELFSVEDRGGLDFTAAAEDSGNAPQVGSTFKLMGTVLYSLGQERLTYHNDLLRVKEDWKQISSNDLKQANNLEDKANRALSDKNYYLSQNMKPELAAAEERYKQAGDEFILSVKNLDQVVRSRYSEWTKCLALARILFFERAIKVLEENNSKIEAVV